MCFYSLWTSLAVPQSDFHVEIKTCDYNYYFSDNITEHQHFLRTLLPRVLSGILMSPYLDPVEKNVHIPMTGIEL